MSKTNFEINDLRVAAPCPASWDAMTGDERRRFCDLCQLNVYNFSEMTGAEIRALIAESEGRVCGRLYKRADGTVLTKDCPTGVRAYRRKIARFAGAALTAVLGLFSFSFGQQPDEKPLDEAKIKIVRSFGQENVLTGTITDESGAVIPGAEIKLFQDQIYLKSVLSDAEGKFQITSLTAESYILEVQANGFRAFKSDSIEFGNNEQVNIRLELSVGEITQGMVVELPRDERNVWDLLKIQPEIIPRKSEKPEKP